jgi:hypothetical protein
MKEIDVDGLDPQVEPIGEKAHRGARMVLSMVPAVGGPLVEVFNSVIESPLTQRRWKIVQEIGEVINNLLEQKLVTENDLQNNEAFISTVAEACSIALRNHQQEKLEALKNAVKNSALPNSVPEDYRQMFLNFVDVCTVTHIKLLHLYDDPVEWLKKNDMTFNHVSTGGLSSLMEHVFPGYRNHSEMYQVIWKDLYQRGLVNIEGVNGTMSRSGIIERRSTAIGTELIKFIS